MSLPLCSCCFSIRIRGNVCPELINIFLLDRGSVMLYKPVDFLGNARAGEQGESGSNGATAGETAAGEGNLYVTVP